MRKTLAVIIGTCAVAALCHADDLHRGPQVSSLIEGSGYWSTWLKPEASLTSMDGDIAGIGGGSVGLALERTFYVGLGYYGLLGSVDLADEAASMGSFDLWYTGLDMGYTFATERLIHGGIGVMLGGGKAKADLDSGGADEDSVFVAVPQVTLALNMATDVEVGIGVGYRFVDGGPEITDDGDLSGMVGSLFFRFTETR